MRLKPSELPRQLSEGLAPIYVISGDEPFQALEASDTIRAAARERGHTERQVHVAGNDFDWDALTAGAAMGSLFGEGRLLEVRLPGGKPGDSGGRALRAFAEDPPPDTVLLLTLPRLDGTAQRAKWFKTLEQVGVWLPIWPLEGRELQGWVRERLGRNGLDADAEAIGLLMARVEGNLVAAAQEVDKLALLHPPGPLSLEAVADAVVDSARYNIFDLARAALDGEPGRVYRILEGLRGEGVAPQLVLWALAREARAVAGICAAAESGQPPPRQFGGPPEQMQARQSASRRFGWRGWRRVVSRCARADRVLKGAESGREWDELVQLGLIMAGRPLFPKRPARPTFAAAQEGRT